jgi:hypothetical protein
MSEEAGAELIRWWLALSGTDMYLNTCAGKCRRRVDLCGAHEKEAVGHQSAIMQPYKIQTGKRRGQKRQGLH